MAVITIGPGKDYTTIQAAITAATEGDLLLVDAGTYTEDITIPKCLTLRGDGNITDVIVQPATNTDTIVITADPAGAAQLSIERMLLKPTGGTGWVAVVRVDNSVARTNLAILFFRCYFNIAGSGFPTTKTCIQLNAAQAAIASLTASYCTFEKGYDHIAQFQDTVTLQDYVLSCEFDETMVKTSCGAGHPAIEDYVITPTGGYGYQYGPEHINFFRTKKTNLVTSFPVLGGV
jgi:hypothetical protein